MVAEARLLPAFSLAAVPRCLGALASGSSPEAVSAVDVDHDHPRPG